MHRVAGNRSAQSPTVFRRLLLARAMLEEAADYARAGVPEYWIVDVLAEVVVVHRERRGEDYGTITEHRDGTIRPLLPAPPLARRVFV